MYAILLDARIWSPWATRVLERTSDCQSFMERRRLKISCVWIVDFTMKIAVLGATGGTGIQIVKQALAAKHDVIAIVRNPDKLKEIQNSRLTVMPFNI